MIHCHTANWYFGFWVFAFLNLCVKHVFPGLVSCRTLILVLPTHTPNLL